MKNLAKITIIMAAFLICSAKTFAQVGVQVNIAPPAIPDYTQPPCPEDGYLWEPGYWNWDPNANDYYWVPGVWVAPPSAGVLWTPPYWDFVNGLYTFHAGYWGPHVGYYGGINYGGGYFGIGFAGGAWSGGHFRYNTAVWNVNRGAVHNVYVDRTVIKTHTIGQNHISYHGPRPEEVPAAREKHVQPTAEQQSHVQAARADKSQFHAVNHGKPSKPAVARVSSGQRGGGGRGKH
jgi:hypothetical protein